MRFKVVVCSGCGWARGVRSGSKRVSCPRCGAVIKVQEAVAYFETDSEGDLVRGVADVNERLHRRG